MSTIKPPSINEPVTLLRRVPIRESGEPMVDFVEHCPNLVLDRPRFHYQRATFLRRSVAEMLGRAADALPDGVRLAVIEGWRPLYIQRRMYLWSWARFQARHPEWSEAQLRRVVNRFTAPVSERVPPPHSTGGAVDLALIGPDGEPLDVTSPYDRMDPRCYPMRVRGLSPQAEANRELLRRVLEPTGITNYPSEYWHWSYGDQGWAFRGGHAHALYGATEPPGWVPVMADAVDAPLERVGQ